MNDLIQILESGNREIDLSDPKLVTNKIRKTFSKMSIEIYNKAYYKFEEVFPSPDFLHNMGDVIADEIRCNSIDVAMQIIVTDYEIYDITEDDFRLNFVMPNDHWEKYFSEIEKQFGKIINNEKQKEIYRKYRKEHRHKYYGYSIQDGLVAGALNIVTGFAHDLWNTAEKAIESSENEDKKLKIYTDKNNIKYIAKALSMIPIAVFDGVITFLNLRKPGSVYEYSANEKKREFGMMEHIIKGRIKRENLLSAFKTAINLYPYDDNIYSNLVKNFGDVDKKIEKFVEFLGLKNLALEKKNLFYRKIKELSNKNYEEKYLEAKEYIKFIGYDDGKTEVEKIKNKEKIQLLHAKIKNINITTVESFLTTFDELYQFLNTISYHDGIKIVDKVKHNEQIKLFNATIKSVHVNTVKDLLKAFDDLKNLSNTIEYPEGIQILEKIKKDKKAQILNLKIKNINITTPENLSETFNKLNKFVTAIDYPEGKKILEKVKNDEKVKLLNLKIKNISINTVEGFFRTFIELHKLLNDIDYPEGMQVLEKIKNDEKMKLLNSKIKNISINTAEDFFKTFTELHKLVNDINYPEGIKILEKVKNDEKVKLLNLKIKYISINTAEDFLKTFTELHKLVNDIGYFEGIKKLEKVKNDEKTKLFKNKIKAIDSLEKFDEQYNTLKNLASTIQFSDGIVLLENKKMKLIAEEERKRKINEFVDNTKNMIFNSVGFLFGKKK